MAFFYPLSSLLELPNKTDLYATLLGVLNIGNRELVGLCLDRLNSYLESMKWWHVVQVSRIMVELCNVNILPDALLNSFYLEASQKYVNPSASGELMAISILLSLPWIKSSTLPKLTNLEQVLNLVGAVAECGNRFTVNVSQFDVKVAGFQEETDFLKRLYYSVRTLSNFEGRTEPYKAFESVLSGSQSHAEFVIGITEEALKGVEIEPFSPIPLFSDSFSADKGDFFALYYQFMVHMLVEAYELNHRRAAEVLFSCLPSSISTPEKVICQVVFGKLIHATVVTKIAYYEVLLIDCCRLSRVFPPMMARSLNRMVAKMDMSSDLEVLNRLASWFAHHLSHYDFKWNWAEWQSISESKIISTQRVFLRMLVYRLLLLSYHEKMESVLPEFMLPMLPYKSSSAIPSEGLSKEVHEFLKKRPSLQELQSKIVSENWDVSKSVFEVMLLMGSKTFSHLLNAFERYSELFKDASRDSKLACIEIAYNFWARNPQNLHIVLEKMVHYGIVDVESVVDFLFGKAALAFTSLSAKDVHSFEVEILIKMLSGEFLITMIKKFKYDKAVFAINLLERIIHFGSAVTVGDVAASVWLPWTVKNLVKTILREFFTVHCEDVQIGQQLIEIAKNDKNYPEDISAMIVGIVESMN